MPADRYVACIRPRTHTRTHARTHARTRARARTHTNPSPLPNAHLQASKIRRTRSSARTGCERDHCIALQATSEAQRECADRLQREHQLGIALVRLLAKTRARKLAAEAQQLRSALAEADVAAAAAEARAAQFEERLAAMVGQMEALRHVAREAEARSEEECAKRQALQHELQTLSAVAAQRAKLHSEGIVASHAHVQH